MVRILPPAGTTSPGCARRYCTRPLRGALRTLSSISAWSRSVVARAASMAACASDLGFGCGNGSLCFHQLGLGRTQRRERTLVPGVISIELLLRAGAFEGQLL